MGAVDVCFGGVDEEERLKLTLCILHALCIVVLHLFLMKVELCLSRKLSRIITFMGYLIIRSSRGRTTTRA